DRAMVTHPGAMNHLTIDDVTPEILKQARHLHFSSFYLQPGIKDHVGFMFKRAKELELTTSFDMQWDPAEKWELDCKAVLPYVDVFLPNKQEIIQLTRQINVREALWHLSSPNIVVVKLSDEGSYGMHKGREYRVPAFLNERVIDAIGAGDSFNAGFIFKYIQDAPIEECMRFGNLIGAINTTAAGGTTAFTNPDEIMKIARERFAYREED
ncbi:MAG TPA: carbohydrate kinase family protein, partial [Calditrichaeota bacterium]|nr:carbohydrate kinase family protein [Calditrichota bacterium]